MPRLEFSARSRGRACVAALGLLLFVLEAWRSAGYYHPDEYFQTVEFASFKLGITPASELPWEFPARIRPFLQPALYTGLARGLTVAGAPDRGVALFAFRLSGAVLAWAAACVLAEALGARLADARGKALLLAASLLTWWVPFLSVRTSSESLSGSLLALGLGSWLLLANRPVVAALTAGLAMGVAFDLRYQTALAAVGFFGWLAAVRRSGVAALAAFAGTFLVAAALGLAVDRWGYGEWTLTPWNYLRVNLMEGAALRWGREPATFYLATLVGTQLEDPATPPLSTLLVVAVVAFWAKAPRAPITWMTLPFVVGHTLLAHKELRFLFPLGPLLAPIAPLLLLDPAIELPRPRAWLARHRWLFHAVVALDLAFLVGLLIAPVRVDLSVDIALRRRLAAAPETVVVLLDTEPFVAQRLPLPFLRPPAFRAVRVKSWAELPAVAASAAAPVVVVARLKDRPERAFRARQGLRLVASTLPEWVARVFTGATRLGRMYALWTVEPQGPGPSSRRP